MSYFITRQWATSQCVVHPDIQYHDFFQNRVVGYAQLREYLQASMPREADEAIEHTDRIRADGDTAFIQYRISQ